MSQDHVRHVTQTINVPLEAAYAYAHRPQAFGEWAAGLASALRETADGWVADTPDGPAIVTFSPPNPYGVLDHSVQFPGQPVIQVPLRMIAHGDRTEIVLTLFRQPGMTDALFKSDVQLVRQDLARLKALLERKPGARRPG